MQFSNWMTRKCLILNENSGEKPTYSLGDRDGEWERKRKKQQFDTQKLAFRKRIHNIVILKIV